MTAPAIETRLRKLLAASAVTNLSDGVGLTAFPLLAAALTRDPVLIAGFTFAFTAPWLVFGLQAGALADRLDRKAVMVRIQLIQAALMSLLGVAALSGHATLALLYSIAFLVGAASTLFDNAAQSVLPALEPPQGRERANGRLLAIERASSEFVGPPVGGVIFSAAAAAPFLAGATGYAAAALLVSRIAGSFRPERTQTLSLSLRAEIGEGLDFVWRARPLRTLLLSVAVLGLVDTAWFSILVLYALEVLDTGSGGFGLLLAAGGVGSIAGGLTAARVRGRAGLGAGLAGALVLAALTQLVLGLASSMIVALVMLAASGFAFSIWNVLSLSLRQTLAPDPLLGRVNSAYRFVGVGATALGALAGGALASEAGLRAPFLAGVPVLLAVASVAVRLTPDDRDEPQDAARRDGAGSY